MSLELIPLLLFYFHVVHVYVRVLGVFMNNMILVVINMFSSVELPPSINNYIFWSRLHI